MFPPISIVWPCPLDVEGYVKAGRGVRPDRQPCPTCNNDMIWWSGYLRFVRGSKASAEQIWIPRAKCRGCSRSQALLPLFLFVRRFYPAEMIGVAVMKIHEGKGTRPVAGELAVPHTTCRDWFRRFRARAPTLVVYFSAAAVKFGAGTPKLSAPPTAAALEALAATWIHARRRFGVRIPALWGLASVMTGGGMLATTTTPLYADRLQRYLMPPAVQAPAER